MNTKAWYVAAALAAAFAFAGCGPSNGDGGVKVGAGVAGLADTQHFCFTWSLYQQSGEDWVLVDAMSEPACAQNGVDTAWSYASCYDGRKFIVAYEVTYYGEDGELGTATGTSGGGQDDICVKNADVETHALFQFRNEGNAGGADLYVDIDQVCTNDKAVLDDGRAISAVWVQPGNCTEGPPDSYCVIGSGCGLETVRYGVTADGMTRFIFNESDDNATWSLYFLFFEPTLPTDELILQHSPYVLHHLLSMGRIDREELNAGVVFRYEPSGQSASANIGDGVGFIMLDGDLLRIVYDLTGTCNEDVDLDASQQNFRAPRCEGQLALLGAIPAGGSAFTLVLECSTSGFEFVSCDARGVPGGICRPTQNLLPLPAAGPIGCAGRK